MHNKIFTTKRVILVVLLSCQKRAMLARVIPIVLQSIAILLKFCNTYCNTLKELQFLLQHFNILQYFL